MERESKGASAGIQKVLISVFHAVWAASSASPPACPLSQLRKRRQSVKCDSRAFQEAA